MKGMTYNKVLLNGYIVICKNPQISHAIWDLQEQHIDLKAVAKADYIIHLAGAGVMDKRWTKKYKEQIAQRFKNYYWDDPCQHRERVATW